METTTLTAECKEIQYPAKCKSLQAKKKHKEKTLQENPECLYVDYTHLNGKKIKNNFIFHTKHPELWRNAVCDSYQHTFKEGIGRGGRVTICQDESLDTEDPLLTLTYYKNKGTVLLQGNQTNLNSFEKMFHQLKAEVDKNRSNSATDSEDPTDRADTEESEQEEEEEERKPTEKKDPDYTPPSALTENLRESLSSLELDFTEFRELILTRLTELNNIQQLRKELQQMKHDHQKSIDELRQTTYILQEENTSLRAQMAKIQEDTGNREKSLRRQLEHMKSQVQVKSPCTPHRHSSAHMATTGSQTQLSTVTPDPQTRSPTPASDHSALARDGPTPPPTTTSPDTDPLPAGQGDSYSTPTPSTTTKPEPQVVLLMDSNGKYVQPKRLFPGQHSMSKRCRNTKHALELLQQDSLGCPRIIIIHTGTNDLHSLRRDTAQAVTKVAERACRVFPESRIVISTLLPRTDTPPHVIHDINMEITRNCSILPNIHLAHHTTIGTWHLHDGLHLNRDGVRIFAKTLKDVALGRNPNPTSSTDDYRTPRVPRNTPSQPSSRHPALLRRPPHRPHQPPAPQTQRAPPVSRAPLPQQQMTYAAALTRPAPQPAPLHVSELDEIRQMLRSLCSTLLVRQI